MTNLITEMNWVDFKSRLERTKTVIIPSGAIEVYGPHLPLSADCIAAEAIALKVADKVDAIISPSLNIGESLALRGFPGTFTYSRETYFLCMKELFKSLIDYGFKNFMFITGHAGNVDTINYLVRYFQQEYDIKCGQIDWWRFANVNGTDIFELKGHMAHGHASECGTSVMMYLRPDLVKTDRITTVEPKTDSYEKYTDFIRYTKFEEKTEIGQIGNADIASKEKGEAIINKCVDRVVEYMKYEFKI